MLRTDLKVGHYYASQYLDDRSVCKILEIPAGSEKIKVEWIDMYGKEHIHKSSDHLLEMIVPFEDKIPTTFIVGLTYHLKANPTQQFTVLAIDTVLLPNSRTENVTVKWKDNTKDTYSYKTLESAGYTWSPPDNTKACKSTCTYCGGARRYSGFNADYICHVCQDVPKFTPIQQ